MKEYIVKIYYKTYDEVPVKANSKEEAWEKVEKQPLSRWTVCKNIKMTKKKVKEIKETC